MESRSRFTTGALAVAIAAILSGCFQAPEPDEADAPDSGTERASLEGEIKGRGAEPAPPPAPPAEPVTEMDLGVPLYPGAALLQPQSSRQAGADRHAVTGVFAVADPPAVVSAYYRDYLQARAQGAEILETATPGGGVMLVLDEPGAETAVQVEIEPHGQGSRVRVMSVVFPIR